MKSRVQVQAWQCICEVEGCPRHGLPWISIGKRPPIECSTCRSREWDGVKRKRGIALPKPPRVRDTYDDEF